MRVKQCKTPRFYERVSFVVFLAFACQLFVIMRCVNAADLINCKSFLGAKPIGSYQLIYDPNSDTHFCDDSFSPIFAPINVSVITPINNIHKIKGGLVLDPEDVSFCQTLYSYYKDADKDGYSDGTTLKHCIRREGYYLEAELTSISGDCNDANKDIFPEAEEICNKIDDNCNEIVDEGCSLMCPPDGDVNADGRITFADALLAFKYSLNMEVLDECQQNHADVNNDSAITPADALCIFRKSLLMESCLD